ncbi:MULTISPECIES: hypothetical protein [Nostocales]|uniref:Uncharacterized protein n=3 Tax=Nostocales TaxID=1161 RepID=A0A8S9T716_9CYAN|nr:hypothetical protein [Tolypothrix bouteillei]KAF3888351.1 hypothetical protein DA73_0400024805 [Tolypothrix bouteillei VB521301]
MHGKRKNLDILNLAGLAIAGFSLVFVTLATTIFISPKLVAAKEDNRLAKASTELPIVKSAALGIDMNVPWSKTVLIKDPFEGNYVGIFDRHSFYKTFLNVNSKFEVISLWRKNSVRILLSYRERDCFSGYGLYPYTKISGTGCLGAKNTIKITNLYIKLGEKVFRLEGNNSTFDVSSELATALKNSPAENVDIRLVAESGEAVDSEIGKRTVEGWKNIF